MLCLKLKWGSAGLYLLPEIAPAGDRPHRDVYLLRAIHDELMATTFLLSHAKPPRTQRKKRVLAPLRLCVSFAASLASLRSCVRVFASLRLCVSFSASQHQGTLDHPMKDPLRAKIHNHTAVGAVIGLGYVGLPLAVAFAEKGFPVTFVATQCRPFDTAQDRLWH